MSVKLNTRQVGDVTVIDVSGRITVGEGSYAIRDEVRNLTAEAAHAVGISTKTLLRWQKEPEFDTAFRTAKRAAFGQSIARLHHLSSAAVSTLGKVMLDAATPPATRVRAADSILDHTTKAIEIEEIEARVAALEGATSGAPRR